MKKLSNVYVGLALLACLLIGLVPVTAPAFAQSAQPQFDSAARGDRHESAAASDLLSASEGLTFRSRTKSQAPSDDAIEQLLKADEAVRARFAEVEERLVEAGVGAEVPGAPARTAAAVAPHRALAPQALPARDRASRV